MDLTESSRPHALSTLVATIAAPSDAFAAIEARASWGWALAITVVLSVAGNLLMMPAVRHMLEATVPAQIANDPHLAGLSQEQIAARTRQALAFTQAFSNVFPFLAIVIVPALVAVESALLFGVRSIVRSTASYAQLFALTTHVQFLAVGLGSFVLGAIVALRPADTFRSQSDLLEGIPSLAWLAGGASPKIVAFLASIGPFPIWATIVLALGLIAVARFRPPAAWSSAIALLLLGAGWAAAFAR